MMKKYTAVRFNGMPITSIIAEDAVDAIQQITHQLKKPGREQYFGFWSREGFRMEVTDLLTRQHLID